MLCTSGSSKVASHRRHWVTCRSAGNGIERLRHSRVWPHRPKSMTSANDELDGGLEHKREQGSDVHGLGPTEIEFVRKSGRVAFFSYLVQRASINTKVLSSIRTNPASWIRS